MQVSSGKLFRKLAIIYKADFQIILIIPKGRNPYAHVALCVKTKFGLSYKDIPDEYFEKVINYIEILKNNPN